jgi:predicted transcriptional regulator
MTIGKQAFVIMVQDRWWSGFCRRNHDGKKTHSFVLRGIAPPRNASRVLFYVTKPVGEIAGYADFIERKVGDADELWKEHGDESVLGSKENYDTFVKDSRRVSFVRFKNFSEAGRAIPLNCVLMSLGVRRLSRKGFYIDKQVEDKFVALMRERSNSTAKTISNGIDEWMAQS